MDQGGFSNSPRPPTTPPPQQQQIRRDSELQDPAKPGGIVMYSPRDMFAGGGIVLLGMLCVVPVWNALVLLYDVDYVYWAGVNSPYWMIGSCLFVVALYGLTIFMFFTYTRPQVQTEQSILMIAIIFTSLLGFVLLAVSVPLSEHSIKTYNSLMFTCDTSAETHRLYEYSQVLHNIRRQPACRHKYSVEECVGYQESQPYTGFLRNMESKFRCSGFCHRSALAGSRDPRLSLPLWPPGTDLPPTPSSSKDVGWAKGEGDLKQQIKGGGGEVVVVRPLGTSRRRANASSFAELSAQVSAQGRMLLSYDRSTSRRTSVNSSAAASANDTMPGDTLLPSIHRAITSAVAPAEFVPDVMSPSKAFARAAKALAIHRGESGGAAGKNGLPPALFSDSVYHVTCDGMSARHMKSYAGDIGFQSFYQGIYLIFVAILIGFLKLLGFCMDKDQDVQYFHQPKAQQ